MTDEQTLTLPSGKTAVIRNYTTRADDAKADAVLYAGVTSNKDGEMDFPLSNIMASTTVYVERLVKSIDGEEKNTLSLLSDLRSEDYSTIEKAVQEVVDTHSPKEKPNSKTS